MNCVIFSRDRKHTTHTLCTSHFDHCWHRFAPSFQPRRKGTPPRCRRSLTSVEMTAWCWGCTCTGQMASRRTCASRIPWWRSTWWMTWRASTSRSKTGKEWSRWVEDCRASGEYSLRFAFPTSHGLFWKMEYSAVYSIPNFAFHGSEYIFAWFFIFCHSLINSLHSKNTINIFPPHLSSCVIFWTGLFLNTTSAIAPCRRFTSETPWSTSYPSWRSHLTSRRTSRSSLSGRSRSSSTSPLRTLSGGIPTAQKLSSSLRWLTHKKLAHIKRRSLFFFFFSPPLNNWSPSFLPPKILDFLTMEEAKANVDVAIPERGFRKIAWAFLRVFSSTLSCGLVVENWFLIELVSSCQYFVLKLWEGF